MSQIKTPLQECSPIKSGGLNFVETLQSFPSSLYSTVKPTKVNNPKLLLANSDLATSLNIDKDLINNPLVIAYLSGNELIPNTTPIAMAYAGHQFGHFTTLGDGRAILLGTHQVTENKIYDLQLKGSGPTPYSRGGDGMATLKAMLKEYLFGEALYSLGIPTTRSLALITSTDQVFREKVHPRAVLTRVASSHIRVGNFELAIRTSPEVLKQLADYTIARHYPQLFAHDEPYLGLLEKVIDGQAQLVAQWMSVGFIHGVLNTDNVSIACESIDFGPCAFMDTFNKKTVFSSIDRNGRYAYGNQPNITLWNLCRFAECLLPLIGSDDSDLALKKAENALEKFIPAYEAYWAELFSKKIGFKTVSENSLELINQLLDLMQIHELDFTHTFRELSEPNPDLPELNSWLNQWSQTHEKFNHEILSVKESMLSINPCIIPRTYILDDIIDKAESTLELDDYQNLLKTIKTPYSSAHKNNPLAQPRPKDLPPSITFCGT